MVRSSRDPFLLSVEQIMNLGNQSAPYSEDRIIRICKYPHTRCKFNQANSLEKVLENNLKMKRGTAVNPE